MTGERIGHGGLGLRAPLLSFDAFADQTASTKQAFLELQGGKLAQQWQLESGATYVAPLQEIWDGVVLDVVGILTSSETLSRVETLAACNATAGSFYYGPDALTLTPLRWDDGVSAYDDGVKRWDSGGFLYVHLGDESNPQDDYVVALFGFYFGTRGTVEPALGPEKLTDQGIEAWTSPTVPTNYTTENVGATGVAINRESTIKEEGSFAAKITPGASALAIGAGGGFYQGGMAGVAGAHYIASGRYYTEWSPDTTQPEARLGVSSDGDVSFVASDGRSTQSTKVTLRATAATWRRFMFVARCPGDTTDLRVHYELRNTSGAASLPATGASVYFDDLHVFRVIRYVYYEPRLSPAGLPELQRAANDVWFGSEAAGLGAVTVLNRDDERDDPEPYLETMLGRYQFCSRSAFLRYGGRLVNGQEIPFENTEPGWAGVTQTFEVDASQATFQLESVRGILTTELPLQFYNRLDFPGLSVNDEGRPRPIVFGTITNARPAQTDLTDTSDSQTAPGLGIYETQDPTYRGVMDFDLPLAVYAYENEEAAAKKDAARRVPLEGGSGINHDYSTSIPGYGQTGSFALMRNPGPVRITAGENDAIDFDIGGGALEAFITPGLYSWQGLLDAIASSMATASGGSPPDFLIEYGSHSGAFTAHRVYLTFTAGATLNLRLDTGANKQRSAFPTIGFAQSTDQTGALTYLGNTEIPHDPDSHVIRVDFTGAPDDNLGTFTGVFAALIERPPDIAHAILRRVLKQPASSINLTRFIAARSSSPQECGVYIGGLASVQGGEASTLTVQEVFDRLELSGYGDLAVDHAGRWDWTPRVDDVSGYAATIATVLTNADFLAFSSARTLADVYHVARVNFAQDPSTGIVKTREQVNPAVPAQFARRNSRTFDTYLISDSDAAGLVLKLSRPAAIPVNRYRFTVKGKLLRVRLGDVVDVSARLRKLEEPAGQAEPYLIRLTELSVNPLTHVAEAAGFTQFFGVAI